MIEIHNQIILNGIIIFNSIIFIASVLINYLGVKFSFWNNIHTISSMSDKYFTMITPAKYAFGIWGLIYALGTTVMVSWWRLALNQNINLFNEMSTLIFIFMAISILNPIWILTWIREKILLSWLVMISILILLLIASKLSSQLDNSYAILLRTFFNSYLGWISIAFTINTSVLLITYGITPISMTSMKITSGIIIILTMISLFMLFYYKNLAFTLVILWSLLGIYFQRDSRVIKYETLKTIVLSCAFIIGSSTGYVIFHYIKNM